MARDEHLLHAAGLGPAVLRLYAWSPPTLSLGYFQRYADVETLPESLRRAAVVRRCSGGGAILHDRELTYALVLDDSLDLARQAPAALYDFVHGIWRDLLAERGLPAELAGCEHAPAGPRGGPFLCFERPGRGDLLLGRDKLLGSAQRRVAGRVLQHGSLLLGRTFADHPGGHLNDPAAQVVREWTSTFVRRVAEGLRLDAARATWTQDRLLDVAQRRGRYAGEAWTRRR